MLMTDESYIDNITVIKMVLEACKCDQPEEMLEEPNQVQIFGIVQWSEEYSQARDQATEHKWYLDHAEASQNTWLPVTM